MKRLSCDVPSIVSTRDQMSDNLGENVVDYEAALYRELWHECAGPHVFVPYVGENVVYFPQGHIQQDEASTNRIADQDIIVPNLPWKILCQVINVQLEAKPDTDEVYAQMTLLPKTEQDESKLDTEMRVPLPSRIKMHSFSKTLTASDTSTDELLLPLDMISQPSPQELSTKDLCGNEWRFQYISKCGTNGHMLSGWNDFVQSKKLAVDDTVIFLRGENGELRIGVRRAIRQNDNFPSSLNMCGYVLSTALQAFFTKALFTVKYKPRFSPAEFIVPIDHYLESVKNKYSVGTRIKMKFEGDEASEQRSTGTIVGLENADPKMWPESQWNLLLVKWDKSSTIPHPDRVSPWNIEPELAPIVPSPLPVLIPQWPRSSMTSSFILTKEDCTPAKGLSRVWQSQELSTLKWIAENYDGDDDDEDNDDAIHNSIERPPSLDHENVDNVSVSMQYGSDSWMSHGKRPYKELLGTEIDTESLHGIHSSTVNETETASCETKRRSIDQQENLNTHCTLGTSVPPREQQDKASNKDEHQRDGYCQPQNASTRSSTKVYKEGLAFGRCVDLAKFDSYDTLIAELDQLFDFGGELMSPQKNWLLLFTDDEGDMMLMGDYPWQKICAVVHKIFIYTKETMQKKPYIINNSKGEKSVSVEKDIDANDMKNSNSIKFCWELKKSRRPDGSEDESWSFTAYS